MTAQKKMEVESCNISESFYCIWFEYGFLRIEDMEAQKTLVLFDSQLRWFIEAMESLVRDSKNRFCLSERAVMKMEDQGSPNSGKIQGG